MNVEEFAHEFFQDVLADSDAEGQFVEDTFFQKACERLMEAGDLDAADRVHYRSLPKGIRVDGYGGDPAEAARTLSLIVVDLHHGPEIGRLSRTEMDTAFRRLSNFLRHSLDSRWRNALEETNPAFGLADLIAQRWSSVAKVRFVLVSNRALSERVDGRSAEEIEGTQVTYSVWDIRRLHAQATVGHGREAIEVDLVQDFGGALPMLSARQAEVDHEVYLAVIPGEILANIYDRWGARLLEQNVRVFLQSRGKVNRGIRITLETEPGMFFAYNNGITATAEHIETSEQGGQLMLHSLRNFQIVNGGQTTASIHSSKLRKVNLSRTFVQMKLCVVGPERATELVPRISEYANSQNRVTAADFFANHPFHVRVETFSRRLYAPSPDGTFRQSKWFYERARGQYADARANLTPSQRRRFDLENPRNQVFAKTDLAKFLSVWQDRPHEVSLGAQKNFAAFATRIGKAWEKAPDEFNESWYREAIAKAIIFKATERIVRSQPWYEGGYRANIVAHTIAKVSHDVASRHCAVNFDLVWRLQSPGKVLQEVLAVNAKHVLGVLIHPPEGISNVTEWAKKQACWERVRKLDGYWTDELGDELVTLQDARNTARSARSEQRVLNGIEAQIAVVNAGGPFWKDVLSWGKERKLLTPTESGILEVVAGVQERVPTDRQSSKAIEVLSRLQCEGYAKDLPVTP